MKNLVIVSVTITDPTVLIHCKTCHLLSFC